MIVSDFRMWITEARLRILLGHLVEVKPSVMPVGTGWRIEDYSQVAAISIHQSSPPPDLPFLLPLCFATFPLAVLDYRPPISLDVARLCMQGLCLLSPVVRCLSVSFYAQVYSSYACLLLAYFYFSTVAHYKVLQRTWSKATRDASEHEGHAADATGGKLFSYLHILNITPT